MLGHQSFQRLAAPCRNLRALEPVSTNRSWGYSSTNACARSSKLRSLLDLVDHHDESPFPQPKWFLMNKKTQLANQLGKGKRKTTN